MGLPTGATERSTHHQFPFRGKAVSSRSMPDSGVAFLRVHGDQIAEAEVEVHEGGRGLVLLCRPMASDAPRRRSIHAAHDRAWAGCRAHSRPTDGRSGKIRLAGLAPADRKRSSTTAGA